MNAQTLRVLDRYAAARHVDLVPCLQSLGHMEHVLALPEYEHLAESEARWSLSPAEPGSYELLRDLYDEYLPNFRSHYLNANCDEPYDLGKGKSAARSEELGPGGVYLEHIERLRGLAEARGKRLMIWGDVVHQHAERIPEISRDLTLLDWWYEAEFDYDRVRVFAENGIDFMVCPGTSSWNSLFPRVDNSLANISGWAEAGRRHGARGMINTDWGDFGHYNLQGNSFFAYAWGAQESWSGPRGAGDFDRAFSRALFDDATGEVARLYRALGAIHDPGFRIHNGSPLVYLYFDELERAFFVSAAKRAALTRCETRLVAVAKRIAASQARFGWDVQTYGELEYAAAATLMSVRKAQAGLDYIAWRRKPDAWKARERKQLARAFEDLAKEQSRLQRTLKRLWLARAEPSDLRQTELRIRGSIASLRRAARLLKANRPSPPPPRHEGFTLGNVMEAVRASLPQAPRTRKLPARDVHGQLGAL